MKTRLLISVIFLFVMIPWAKSQWTYTNLSEPKYYVGVATLGNKAYFAGGYDKITFKDKVEVYDVSTDTWDVAGSLFIARQIIGGSASCGSKIFFAGGFDEEMSYDIVDIYDTLSKEWSVGQLSVDRFALSAISRENTVMFAGGVQFQQSPVFLNTVDLYNTETGVWTVDHLSIARMGITATVVGDLAFFAGGIGVIDNTYKTTERVDIYNFTTKTWSQASLSQARAFASAVTVGGKVMIAGGITEIDKPTDRVDIYDASTGIWTTALLSDPRAAIENAVVVSGKAYFVGGGNFMGGGFNYPSKVIDIYDPVHDKWTIDSLSQPLESHSVAGIGNHLVVAGGKTVGGLCVKKVEILFDSIDVNVGFNSKPKADASFSIYPNPCFNILNISVPNGKTIDEVIVYNQTGQKVLQGKQVYCNIDISKLKPGIYIIKVVTKEGNGWKKLIVE